MLDIPPECEVQHHEDDSAKWHHSIEMDAEKKVRVEREMARCHACSDRFQWPLVIYYCPYLIQKPHVGASKLLWIPG